MTRISRRTHWDRQGKATSKSEKVMNTAKPMDKCNTWSEINWKKVERQVFKLQKRIYQASQKGDVKLVHKLQRLLIKSHNGKLIATRKVTQDNQGKKTAGVDKIKCLTPKQRFKLVKNLKLGKKVKPSRRVWIPKPKKKEKRPLGIPTIYERALQALVKLALEPEWEAIFEPNSYGFRPGRGTHDAIEAIFLAIKQKSKYVLDADIAQCFDKINYEKLLTKMATYPSLKRQVKAWLKSGVLENDNLFPTMEGTPQGGVISPLLANIALHGMEERIKQYARTIKGKKAENERSLNLIRYADDFVILHEKLEVVQKCQEIIEEWLGEMGLNLNKSKTTITHTLNEYEGKIGFDFLGFTVRQFPVGKNHSGKNTKGVKLGFKTLIKPSKEKIKIHQAKMNKVIQKHKSSPQIKLIQELNPIIRGWSNYYATVVSKEIFSSCDHVTYNQLRRWANRRHPKQNHQWIVHKYWHPEGDKKWVFSVKNQERSYQLRTHVETPIVRHIKVKGSRSPFDGDLIYWASRLGRHPELSKEVGKLLKKQKGRCNHCGLIFKDEDLLEVDHIIPCSLGGNNSYSNKQLLHRHCHDVKTAHDGSLTRIHDKKSIREERNEAKESCYVLKTSKKR
jgi:RNA-directed DNA polymerase